MEQFRLPQIQMPELPLPSSIQAVLAEAEEKLAHRPKLQRLFRNCFPNTLETTTKLLDDGTTFVITGDIPACWLRDSVEQVIHYVPFAAKDPDLQRMIGGLIKRHTQYVLIDPYANAFNETANDWHWNAGDVTEMSPWVWERKFEIDSLCFVIRLAHAYWEETKRTDIFTADFKKCCAPLPISSSGSSITLNNPRTASPGTTGLWRIRSGAAVSACRSTTQG